MPRQKVVVLGGGIIGCAIAWRLALRGQSVTVFDKGPIGQEASWAAGGILSPNAELAPGPLLDLGRASLARYPSFLEELRKQSDTDPLLRDGGLLELAGSFEDLPDLRSRFLNIDAETRWCERKEIASLEPLVDSPGGFWILNERSIDPRRLTLALSEAARAAGATLLESTPARRVLHKNNRAIGLDIDGEEISFDRVVIAAGSWSSLLCDGLLPTDLIEPIRGQVLLLEPKQNSLSRVVYANGGYLVPRQHGRILVGATSERVGFEKANTCSGVQSLLNIATKTMPSLAEAKLLESWSGLRPASQDGLPILGKSHIENLVLATGHYRNGILLAPITADLITSILLEEPASLSVEPFSVNRFLGRASPRR